MGTRHRGAAVTQLLEQNVADDGRGAGETSGRSVALRTADCTVELERDAERATLTISGDVDLANADELLALLRELIEGGVRDIDIDVGALAFIDSFGLGRLVLAQQAAIEAGATMRLLRVGPRTRRVLVISGLYAYLNVANGP